MGYAGIVSWGLVWEPPPGWAEVVKAVVVP